MTVTAPPLDEMLQRLERLEQAYANIDPFEWSWSGRGRDFCYGETATWRFLDMMKLAGLRYDDRVYDLGCGTGRNCLAVSSFCRKSVGVEIVPEMVRLGQDQIKELGLTACELRCEDIRQADLRDASVVYLYWSTWSQQLRSEVVEHLAEEIASGVRVLSADHPLQHPAFELVQQLDLDWYLPTDISPMHARPVFFQKRI